MGALEGSFVKYRVEKFVEFLRLHAEEGSLLVDFTCTEKIHGDFYHSGAGTFAVTGLKHPEFAILNGELHILHILVVVFKAVGDGDQLGSADGHRFFK